MKPKSLLKVLTLLIATSCFHYEPKKEQIKRSENQLPETAFWVKSDSKKGNWLNVDWIHNHKNLADISIYDSETKELIERRRFFLICRNATDEIERIEDLKTQVSHYENELIHFKESECFLKKR